MVLRRKDSMLKFFQNIPLSIYKSLIVTVSILLLIVSLVVYINADNPTLARSLMYILIPGLLLQFVFLFGLSVKRKDKQG